MNDVLVAPEWQKVHVNLTLDMLAIQTPSEFIPILRSLFVCECLMIIMFLALQKDNRRSLYALRETEFLRLKRTRIGRDDFESLKIIGKGAFGEVC